MSPFTDESRQKENWNRGGMFMDNEENKIQVKNAEIVTSSSDQKNLFLTFKELDKKQVKVMLSNHATHEVMELYRGYQMTFVSAQRSINCCGEKRRKKVKEAVIKNY